MADAVHMRIDDIDAIEGVLEGVKMYKARADLGIEAFGFSIVDIEAGSDQYPEHDHSPEGIGGKMFAKRPGQLGQEEVYVALRGSGKVVTDDGEYELTPEHVIKVDAEVKRHLLPGPDGLRLLCIGGVPGKAYAG